MTRKVSDIEAAELESAVGCHDEYGCDWPEGARKLLLDRADDIAEIERLRTALKAIANNQENDVVFACDQMERMAREALEATP